jgi:DNA (cytosine-5)-methyltransferase 1
MNELHLFAGAGGGILGGLLLGHRPVCAVEINEYCRKILLQRQRDGILPRFPIWDDVQTFDGKPWRGIVDVVCGGFPCQDISAAGKGAGIKGERSILWKHMARIVSEVRPQYVFAENSPLLVGRGLGMVLCDLASLGYDARWGVVGAHHVASPHARERIWILAYAKVPDEKNSKLGESRKREAQIQPRGLHGNKRRTNPWLREMEPKPRMVRVADGMAYRVDRLEAIGNGQVPLVAATAWRILSGKLSSTLI